MTALEIVGRDEELAVVAGFLADTDSLPRVLVIEGEPGIGKTTVWRQVVDQGEAAGYRVLSTRPARSEAQLAFAGLADLFEGSLDDMLPALPPPQARALRVALLLDDPGTRPADTRAVAAAVLGSLRHLGRQGSLLFAIDDVQWLDPSSASALEFAVRRLTDEPIAVVMTVRTAETRPPVLLIAGVDEARAVRLALRPLTLGALHRVLVSHLGLALSRPALRRVTEVSGGNPFFALELGRSLQERGLRPGPHDPVPVPESLTALLGARLGALPTETREALLVAALASEPTVPLIAETLGTDGWEQLRPAAERGVIAFDGEQVSFTHPLLASAVEAEADLDLRRRAHARLATVAADPVARARHLALASSAPDERVARDLEAAAAQARARGAVLTAAALGELAARSTPAGDEAHSRLMRAARDHLTGADPKRAEALANELVANAPSAVGRAEALAFIGEIDLEVGMVAAGIERLEQALAEARGAVELEQSIHHRLAHVVRFEKGVADAERHLLRSVELAERLGDPVVRSHAFSTLAVFRRSVVGVDAREVAERAVSLAVQSGDRGAVDAARIALGDVLTWTGRFEESRALLSELHESARGRDEPVAGAALWYLSLSEFYAGRWDEAHEHAEECRDLGSQYALDDGDAAGALWPAALLASHRDDLAGARRLAEHGLALAEGSGHAMHTVTHRSLLGVLAFRDEDARAAVEHFGATEELRQAGERMLEPNMRFYYPDYVEALLMLGRIDDAVAVLEPWANEAEHLGREWALAHATRCRGLVAAAQGDVPKALALLAGALDSMAAGPYGKARAALALGVARRRARQKRAAREALEESRAIFESLGARGWTDRAARELRRVGGRAPAGSRLTPAQHRVAELVAEGLTTKEVAARLFVSPRTVDGHLAEIYAKLGVGSRTALAHHIIGDEQR